jgi:E3 ubiquitin-protein ligase HERC2
MIPTRVTGVGGAGVALGELETQRVMQVSCGCSHTACITEDGSLYTWGSGGSGKLGHGSLATVAVPHHVYGSGDQITVGVVTCGPHHMAVCSREGQVFSWGFGKAGQLGHSDGQGCYEPQQVLCALATEERGVEVACSSHHTVLRTSGNRVFVTQRASELNPPGSWQEHIFLRNGEPPALPIN